MTIHIGDTIRLKATFYTFAGVLADPTTVSVKIYDSEHMRMNTYAPTNESVGVYYYDYTTIVEGTFSFEFSGTLEGKTTLSREQFVVTW